MNVLIMTKFNTGCHPLLTYNQDIDADEYKHWVRVFRTTTVNQPELLELFFGNVKMRPILKVPNSLYLMGYVH
jgi:hypothetical protein